MQLSLLRGALQGTLKALVGRGVLIALPVQGAQKSEHLDGVWMTLEDLLIALRGFVERAALVQNEGIIEQRVHDVVVSSCREAGVCLDLSAAVSWLVLRGCCGQCVWQLPAAILTPSALLDQQEHTVPTVTMTKDNFNSLINDNAIVIIDFWASWCGPCRRFAPVFEQASEQHDDILFAKVDTEAEQELAGYFQIRSIPTLAVFREQIGIYQNPGALPPQGLEELIGQVRAVDMAEVHKKVKEQQAAAEQEA